MNCNITATPRFKKELKRLGKHYKSLKEDYAGLLNSLQANPFQGTDLGKGLRKIRIAITSKGKGKRGGARVITLTALVATDEADVLLLTIYDKSERENISDQELEEIQRQYAD